VSALPTVRAFKFCNFSAVFEFAFYCFRKRVRAFRLLFQLLGHFAFQALFAGTEQTVNNSRECVMVIPFVRSP
jgi:hypothetical protein